MSVIQFSVERVANGWIVTPKPGQPHIAMTAEDVGNIVATLCCTGGTPLPVGSVASVRDALEVLQAERGPGAALASAEPVSYSINRAPTVIDQALAESPLPTRSMLHAAIGDGTADDVPLADAPRDGLAPSTYDPTTDGDSGLRRRARIRTTSIGDGE